LAQAQLFSRASTQLFCFFFFQRHEKKNKKTRTQRSEKEKRLPEKKKYREKEREETTEIMLHVRNEEMPNKGNNSKRFNIEAGSLHFCSLLLCTQQTMLCKCSTFSPIFCPLYFPYQFFVVLGLAKMLIKCSDSVYREQFSHMW